MSKGILKAVSYLSLLGLLFTQGVFAAPPGSLYLPGETNAPTCAPGDTNCDVDLTSLDDQILTLSGSEIIISDGNSVDIGGLLSGTGTDSQSLTLSGSEIMISNGNSIDISGVFTDTDTDDQTLSFSGNLLVIADGNFVDLTAYLDNTDGQSLTLSGSDLSISGGNSITLPSVTDTDDQTLSLSGSSLTIVDGNSVDLSVLQGTSSLSGATDTTFSALGTGSILYYDGNGWVDLVVGGVGQKLTSGTGGVLSWESDAVSMSGTGSFSGSGTSSRIGEFVFAKSGRQVSDGYLAVNPGTITNGATDYPIWAAMYPEYVSGNDIVFPTNVEGMFLRNVGGNALTEGSFQNDATARPNASFTSNAAGNHTHSITGDRATGIGGGSSGSDNVLENNDGGGSTTTRNTNAAGNHAHTITGGGDNETRPFNRAYQLYTIIDTYGDGDTTPALAGLSDTDTTGASTGSLLYNDGSGWIDLDVGAQDQILTSSGGTLVWGVASGGTSTLSGATDTNITSAATGSLLYFDGSEWIDLDLGTAGQVLMSSGGTLVWQDEAATEDVKVLLGGGTNLVNNNTVTISQTWGSLAAEYEQVEFEVIAIGPTNPIRINGTTSTANWVDNTRIFPMADGTTRISLENMDISGTTATVVEGSSAFDTVNVNIYGIKGQKTVIDSVNTPVNDQAASGYMDIGDMRIQWGSGSANSGTTSFAAAFANNTYSIQTTATSGGNGQLTHILAGTKTTTGFQARGIDVNGAFQGHAFDYVAIGMKP